jgi:Ser/Thr protein kinase RdoA (MazF antagonist)
MTETEGMNTLDDAEPLWREVATFWPELDWSEMIPSHGAYHYVAVFPGVAVVRVSTGTGHEARSRRESETLGAVSALRLPAEVPRVLSPVRTGETWSAVAVGYLPGRRRQAEAWSLVGGELGRVMNGIHSASLAGAPRLQPVREWCGGEQWLTIVTEIAGQLGRSWRRTAIESVLAVLGVEAGVERTLVHGDFGMHNLLWLGEGVSGIIDLDAACLGDPAMDVASLLGVYEREEVASITDAEMLRRAVIHQRSLPLQVAAAAELAGDQRLRDHALGNFVDRELDRSFLS